MRKKAKWLLLLVLLAFILRGSNPPSDPISLTQFSIADWMVTRSFAKAYDRLTISVPEGTDERKMILDAFFQGDEHLEQLAEEIIAAEIAETLVEKGIRPFPPVVFELTIPPTLLIVSQRDKIAEVERIILNPEIEDARREEIESHAEAMGPNRSVLVVNLGGLGLFPPAVRKYSAWISTEIAAHEWGHSYLFFFALGDHYGSSPEMMAINETVVTILAEEVVEKIAAEYGWPEPPMSERLKFDKEMGRIRRKVDLLLARGKIKEAEAYMEEERHTLCGKGYCPRKLNQAYFAFHSSYEGGAAGDNPIPGQLRVLRSKCNSLREFLEKVRGISLHQEFLELLKKEGIK